MREVPLMKEFLAEFRNPKIKLFRRNILDKTMQELSSSRIHQVKAGIKGQADVYGYIKSFRAIPIEIEFKGERTPTSEAQKRWRTFCDEWGILHFIFRARIGEHPSVTLQRWSTELSTLASDLTQ